MRGQGAARDRNESSSAVYRARSMFHDSTWPARGNRARVTSEGLSCFSLMLVEIGTVVSPVPWKTSAGTFSQETSLR